MEDKEFNKLKKDTEEAMLELERLQKLYHNETGVYYIMPLYLGGYTGAASVRWR